MRRLFLQNKNFFAKPAAALPLPLRPRRVRIREAAHSPSRLPAAPAPPRPSPPASPLRPHRRTHLPRLPAASSCGGTLLAHYVIPNSKNARLSARALVCEGSPRFLSLPGGFLAPLGMTRKKLTATLGTLPNRTPTKMQSIFVGQSQGGKNKEYPRAPPPNRYSDGAFATRDPLAFCHLRGDPSASLRSAFGMT